MTNKNIFITFIVPTIGRESLKNAITSLINLKDSNWNAIIIFDRVKQNIDINDERIIIYETVNENINNFAGTVRNIGLEYCKNINSEWIGFLDDDDYLSDDYICKLKEEINSNKNMEVCIFRMGYENGTILPFKCDKNIIRKKVGISFCLKKYIIENDIEIKFTDIPYEDFIFLKLLQTKKYKIIISSYVTYFVRTIPFKYNIYPKVLLNFVS
jgi:hypothetical protein